MLHLKILNLKEKEKFLKLQKTKTGYPERILRLAFETIDTKRGKKEIITSKSKKIMSNVIPSQINIQVEGQNKDIF